MSTGAPVPDPARPTLRVLLVEDSAPDAELALAALERAGFRCRADCVDDARELAAHLDAHTYDIILADYSLPGFDGLGALAMVRERGLQTPLVIVSGVLGEERATEAMKAGVTDFVLKARLDRLGTVVARALAEQVEMRLRREAEEALRAANQRLRGLSHRLVEVHETERRSLARELHDELGQRLTALKLQLQAIARREPVAGLEPCVELVATMLEQVRGLALDLRPPQLDDLGLVPALRDHLARLSRQSGVVCRLDAAAGLPEVGSALALVLFRVAQEALTNALKHAAPTHLDVAVRRIDGGLGLEVRDDGRGFDTARARHAARASSVGLFGMEERLREIGGTLEIVSGPQGTRLDARVPLHAPPEHAP